MTEPPLIRISRTSKEANMVNSVIAKVSHGFALALAHILDLNSPMTECVQELMRDQYSAIKGDEKGFLNKCYSQGIETYVDNTGNIHLTLRITINRKGEISNV